MVELNCFLQDSNTLRHWAISSSKAQHLQALSEYRHQTGYFVRISSRMPFSDFIKRDSIILGVQMKKQEEERLSSYLRSLGPCDVSLKLPALQGLCGLVLVYSKNGMFSSLQLCPQKDVSHRCHLEFYSSSRPWWWMSIIPALEWWREGTKWRPDWPVDSKTLSQK